MPAAPFDSELDHVVAALDHETRRNLMAFYVSEATSPAAITQNLTVEYAALAYHTRVLIDIGAIEPVGHVPPNWTYAATEVGHMAYLKVTEEPERPQNDESPEPSA
jgi:hypothetical protein